jgi:NADH-quinone oxidoreductase subunit N
VSVSWLNVFALDFAIVGMACAVLLADAFFKIPGRVLGWLVTGALSVLFVLSFSLDTEGKVPDGVYVSGAWVMFFKRLFLVAGALGAMGSLDWLEKRTPRRQAEYYALFLFSLSGMTLIPGIRDWVLMVIAFELMGIPLMVLAAWAKTDGDAHEPKTGPEAGFKLFITSATSSAITLFGLAIVVGLARSSTMGAPVPMGAPIFSLGLLMVLAGFCFKVGAAPFHFWLPDTYQGAPLPFVAFLSVAPKAAGLAALFVALQAGAFDAHPIWGPAVGGLAALSMVVGNLSALAQKDARRLLALSGVAQIGYALVALAARTEHANGMALFFIATYVFTNFGVFLVVHVAAEGMGPPTLTQLKGLSRRSPWLGGALLTFLLSLAGIPFVVGFWAKLFVFLAAWRAGLLGLTIAGVVLAVVGLFYYLQVARSTFMSEGESDRPLGAPFAVRAAIVACLLAVVGFGLWPAPLVDQATKAAAGFVKR